MFIEIETAAHWHCPEDKIIWYQLIVSEQNIYIVNNGISILDKYLDTVTTFNNRNYYFIIFWANEFATKEKMKVIEMTVCIIGLSSSVYRYLITHLHGCDINEYCILWLRRYSSWLVVDHCEHAFHRSTFGKRVNPVFTV